MSVAEREASPKAAAPRGSARIGARAGIAYAQAKAAREKRSDAERKAARHTMRAIIIGVGAGVALYVVVRIVMASR